MTLAYSDQLRQRGGEILSRLMMRALPHVAEIGVATGNLSRFLLEGHPGLHLTMVDHWLPGEQRPAAYQATGDSNAQLTRERAATHRQLAHNVVAQFSDRCSLLEGDSASFAAPLIGDLELDLCFIDADHSYTGVHRDVRAWWPKVKPGGWVGGHDYDNLDSRFDFTGVRRAVDEWAEAEGHKVITGANFTWWVRRPAE